MQLSHLPQTASAEFHNYMFIPAVILEPSWSILGNLGFQQFVETSKSVLKEHYVHMLLHPLTHSEICCKIELCPFFQSRNGI
jgi:hypothetical protein